jgi:glycosyltransferase involved in cell wall biosynthesis
VRILGDTPGLSQPAPSILALVNEYQSSRIFINTSTISPVPTALLEAMACGCACVSLATCMIPEIIQDGVNGIVSNDEKVLRDACEYLLNNEEFAIQLGQNARQTIVEHFHKDRFLNQWNNVFRSVL